jgi:hypothetical protein
MDESFSRSMRSTSMSCCMRPDKLWWAEDFLRDPQARQWLGGVERGSLRAEVDPVA